MLNAQLAILASASIALTATPAITRPIPPDAKTYRVPLTGPQEVNPVPALGLTGDFDGSALVQLVVEPDTRQICYDFRLSGLSTPLMAHIHRGTAQHNGPSVITLFTGPGGNLHDCVTWREDQLAELVANPSNFYVNLATTEFPDGAVRGQLSS